MSKVHDTPHGGVTLQPKSWGYRVFNGEGTFIGTVSRKMQVGRGRTHLTKLWNMTQVKPNSSDNLCDETGYKSRREALADLTRREYERKSPSYW